MIPNNMKQFESICGRISLNIPSTCIWEWDKEFNTALVVFDKDDAELIYFPMIKEFDQQWDYFSIDDSSQQVKKYINSLFGIMPGQNIFTSTEVADMILFAAWWPWGGDSKISLRVGLLPLKEQASNKSENKRYLAKWFNL